VPCLNPRSEECRAPGNLIVVKLGRLDSCFVPHRDRSAITGISPKIKTVR
jgi:hypothetical protein